MRLCTLYAFHQLICDISAIDAHDAFLGPPIPEYHRKWVEEVLKNRSNQREAKWTESIAVGDEDFVMETKAKLGARAIGRRGMKNIAGYELRESPNPYNRVFDPEKCNLTYISHF